MFIIPEKRDLHVLDDEFRLKPISKPRGWPDVNGCIDFILSPEDIAKEIVRITATLTATLDVSQKKRVRNPPFST